MPGADIEPGVMVSVNLRGHSLSVTAAGFDCCGNAWLRRRNEIVV